MTQWFSLQTFHRLAMMAILCLMACPLFPVSSVDAQEVPELKVNSKRYIVIDAETGQVFAQKGSRDQVAIASLTKIFTAILAIESAPLNTDITTDSSDVFDSSSTTMGFGAGETFTLEELLYGMMLPSGNDAAHAIARSLGQQPGDSPEQAVSRYMDTLNQRIVDMGLRDTHLVNPHGWGVPGHVSSAWDLAAFMMFALKYPTFVDTIGAVNFNTSNGYWLSNTNKLLRSYDGLIGGKTGYDDDAGWCLVEVAERDGSTMISVTLDGIAPDDWYDDNRVLLDYAFTQKAASDPNNPAVRGERVAYLDPDAAVIARNSDPGADFFALSPALADDQGESRRSAIESAGRRADGPAFDRGQLWVAAVAAGAIFCVRTLSVYGGRRRARGIDSERQDT